MKKTGTLLFLILLMVAMAGALVLLKQNQDTRKGATFANTTLSVIPSEKIIKNINETVSTQLWFYTENDSAKVDGVQTVVCYGKELSLTESGVVVNTEAGFDESPIVAINNDDPNKNCAIVVVISKKAAADLVTTAKAVTLNFTAVSAGSGEIVINKDKSMVTGDNSASAIDKSLAITSVAGTTYEIGGAANCNRCSTIFDYMRAAWTATDCSADPVGLTVTRTYDVGCTGVSNPLQCSRCSTINDKEYVWWNHEEGKTCADDPVGLTVYQAPKEDCSIAGLVESPILNYKVSYSYVKAGDNKCLVNWPLQVIVLGGGESIAYSNVIPSSKTEVEGKVVLEGSLPLVGFNQTSNVAVFIKGPQHLQRKYAVQNQNGPYNKAGGELTLTKSATTSPVYDFTAYPMLAGDVIGKDSESQDGWISGVDYSYIKTRADLHKTVEVGTYLKGDLDGQCQANANDMNELKISLEQKQEELY